MNTEIRIRINNKEEWKDILEFLSENGYQDHRGATDLRNRLYVTHGNFIVLNHDMNYPKRIYTAYESAGYPVYSLEEYTPYKKYLSLKQARKIIYEQ